MSHAAPGADRPFRPFETPGFMGASNSSSQHSFMAPDSGLMGGPHHMGYGLPDGGRFGGHHDGWLHQQPRYRPLPTQQQQQQQHKPVVNLPSSQAVNMAAVTTHSYGGYDSFGVLAPPQQQQHHQPTMAPDSYGSSQHHHEPVAVGVTADLLVANVGANSSSGNAGGGAGEHGSSGVHGPAAPAAAAGTGNRGPTSTGSNSSRSALSMRRHLSADAPPFELSGRRVSDASGGAPEAGGGRTSDREQQPCSALLRELAERVQQEEQARQAEVSDAAKALQAAQQQLEAEKTARLAAESRASELSRELEAAQARAKAAEQQLSARDEIVAAVNAQRAAAAAEAAATAGRAEALAQDLQDARLSLAAVQAEVASLQDLQVAAEHEKQHLLHRVQHQSSSAVQAADSVAAAAVRAAQEAREASKPPPPGFGPLPHALQSRQQQQQPQQLPEPSAVAAQQQQGVGRHLKNEHELVQTMLSVLHTDARQALVWTDGEVAAVNVQLLPLTWEAHYAPVYGSMQDFMCIRPAVFAVAPESGSFYKYHNSEQVVAEKLAEMAAQEAAHEQHQHQQQQGPHSGGGLPDGPGVWPQAPFLPPPAAAGPGAGGLAPQGPPSGSSAAAAAASMFMPQQQQHSGVGHLGAGPGVGGQAALSVPPQQYHHYPVSGSRQHADAW